MTSVVTTADELRAALADLPRPLALVPTMGALHAGHAALLDAAAARAASVVCSVFVNPLQFGQAVDLETYPRTPDADVALCRAHGVDVVWAPRFVDVYGSTAEPSTTVDPGPDGDVLEGASRPGHFRGVLTVVTVLLNRVRPDVLVLGEKDHQQRVLLTRVADELATGVDVVGVPTVREGDGLALSSRNVRLDAGARADALALPRALAAGAACASDGPSAVLRAARAELDRSAGVEVDHLRLVVEDGLADLGPVGGRGRLLVAAVVGGVRLIDTLGDLDVGEDR